MLIFTTEQLQEQGVSYQEVIESQKIQCSGRNYSRICNFPSNEKESAIDLCRSLLKQGVFSFVCDCVAYLSVWGEEKKEFPNEKTTRASTNFSYDNVNYEILTAKAENITEKPSIAAKSDSYQSRLGKYEVVIREVKNEVAAKVTPVASNENNQILDSELPDLEMPVSHSDSRIYRGTAYELKDSFIPNVRKNAENAAEPKKATRVYRGISY